MEQLHNSKLDYDMAQSQIVYIKESYSKKCAESNRLREKINNLKKQLKIPHKEAQEELKIGNKGEKRDRVLFQLTQRENSNGRQQDGTGKEQVSKRWVQTQHIRRKNMRDCSNDSLGNTPKEVGRYTPSGSKYRSTNTSSFRRRSHSRSQMAVNIIID